MAILIGRDAAAIEDTWQYLYRGAYAARARDELDWDPSLTEEFRQASYRS